MSSLPRVLEPEVMDTEAEAVDYNSMDHSEVNRRFVADLLARSRPGESFTVRILDVGTGTALIPLEFCRQVTGARVRGVDLAAQMLRVGTENVRQAGLAERIELVLVDAKTLPDADATWDWVISNSIIHHIPEPLGCLREMVRVLKPGGLLFVRDLLRPVDEATLQQLVETYAAGANAHQKQMFDDSLHAALTLDEVRALLVAVGWSPDCVQQTSDRHWTIVGRK